MIQFNELRVSADGERLIIDAEVKDFSYFNNVYIDTIFVDSQDTYTDNGPSVNPLYKYEAIDEKRVRLELREELGTSLDKTMFFVYVVTKGDVDPEFDCCCENKITTMGVAVNLYPIYQKLIYGVKQIESDCAIPKKFIDNMLRFKALELSIRTGHYTQAINYWNKYFRNIRNNNTICKCNG